MSEESSRKPESHLVTLAMIAILAGIAVAGHLWSPLLLPKADVKAAPLPGCDLQRQACAAVLPGGARIELSITPRPVLIPAPLR